MTAPAAVTAADRGLASMRNLVFSFFPSLKFYCVHEYSVQESDGVTFSGTPTDPAFSPKLPTRVPYSPALAGSQCLVPVGTIAHVVFANADSTKPRCIGFDLPQLPTIATVDASAAVKVGLSAGAVLVGTTKTLSAAAAVGHFPRYGDNVTVGTAVGVLTLTAPALVSTGQS